MVKIGALLVVLTMGGAAAQQVILDEPFDGNGADWTLSATGYGKPMAEIADGRLLLRPDSGGGETSTASATLTVPIAHTNVDVTLSLHARDGQFFWHKAEFDLLDAEGRLLGTVGLSSQLSAQPGIRVQTGSRRYAALVSDHVALSAGPTSLSFNFHALKRSGQLAGVDERRVRQLRIGFLEQWMGVLEVDSLRVTAGAAPRLLGPAVAPRYEGETVAVRAGVGELEAAADRPLWVSLRNVAVGDDYLKNSAGALSPLMLEVAGRRLTVEDLQWQRDLATRGGVVWRGIDPPTGLRVRAALRPDYHLSYALLWRVEVANGGAEPLEVTPWPLRLDGILQLGDLAEAQRVTMPTWIGFDGPIASYAAGCGGNRIYPQNLSMQYMALTNPESNTGLAVWVRDPAARYKHMDIPVNGTLEAGLVVGFEPLQLPAGGRWTSPDIVMQIGDANWYDSARDYGAWWRSHLRPRPSPDWVHQAGEVFHHCTGYSEQEPPLATHLPTMYRRFQRASRKYPTPMTFDLGEIPDAKRGGAEGEARGLRAMREQFGARGLIYMPAITEYADLPVSRQMTDWYVLRPDGTMLPAWEQNATFCPGYRPVIDYRVAQVLERITHRGADGVYVDESLAQGYHPCYNALHGHPTPYDWGTSQRRLWRALREAVDAERGDVGLITEGCCDVVIDYADAFMAWPSGRSDGVPPMRAAFPQRAYFSNGPAAPEGCSAKAAAGLQLVNGVGAWFVNNPPPAELADWIGKVADWRQELCDCLVAGTVLRDPRMAPAGGVVARAYLSDRRVLLAAVNLGSEPWTGTLSAPPATDWPPLPEQGTDWATGRAVPVTGGRISLSIAPEDVALIVLDR